MNQAALMARRLARLDDPTLPWSTADAAALRDAADLPPAPAPVPPPPSGPFTRLLFEDTFDGATLNTNLWTPYNGPGHVGNGLRRPSAITVANGLLVITATWDGANIISGGMANKTNWTYGTYEARVRTEADVTGQTSGIVMTWPQGDIWPANGENDFYETAGSASATRNPFFSFLHHKGAASSGEQLKITHLANATDWHVMRMEWSPTATKVFRDGVLIGQETNAAYIPSTPHHFSIQLDAVKNGPLPGPVRMVVDYVRMWGA